MSIFICEKCGKLDNTACSNNYYHAASNKYRKSKGKELDKCFKQQFEYFEDHICCSDCCEGIVYKDNSGKITKGWIDADDKKHWSEFGKKELLEWEKRNDGSMVNATEYFRANGI